MTAIATNFGSFLGVFAAVYGWAALDMSLTSACAVYAIFSISFGALAAIMQATRGQTDYSDGDLALTA
ncbi:hypothetical protein VK792_15525 [Mesobacterium sp. TK19101]|uniref:Uncharacterized protein n=1 Tax=Mesobacterium hydrothermale TaxID=3111907 RepID=A0ABU6HLI5_9RHOB|nr:hypothetical protein [Mesobacterium sp. TK19101]MEC3862701.1 hypothetical protein [Mesobacterium sp. TK19101]